MAEHLASIFGTEKDRVNCPFYFKIGTYRIGDRCFRLHTPSLALVRLYSSRTYPRKIQDNYEDFYQELFEELSKHGHIESLDICDNLADHMVMNHRRSVLSSSFSARSRSFKFFFSNFVYCFANSKQVENVYVEFRGEDHVATALQSLTGQFYAEICSIKKDHSCSSKATISLRLQENKSIQAGSLFLRALL
ncbi:Splicing factor U2af small subunit A [Linum perenne]